MAQKSFAGKSLILVFETEVDGEPKRIRKTIKHLAEDATDDVVYRVANTLAGLYNAPLAEVLVDVDYRLDAAE
ncbi:MAG TPA: DUF1659 domain-containing protein [Haloplasmataceae bacterium]